MRLKEGNGWSLIGKFDEICLPFLVCSAVAPSSIVRDHRPSSRCMSDHSFPPCSYSMTRNGGTEPVCNEAHNLIDQAGFEQTLIHVRVDR
jgi:hypothetical protein